MKRKKKCGNKPKKSQCIKIKYENDHTKRKSKNSSSYNKILIYNTNIINFKNTNINQEKEFINFISLQKFWDFNKVSLWSFEEILNYIDEILEKYSSYNEDEINKNILIPLLKFLYLLIQNCYSKEIFASFDNLQKIYLNNLDLKVKILIIEINIAFIENKKCLIHINKLFYRTFNKLRNLKTLLMDLIANNFKLNQSVINIFEELLNNIYRKWSIN